METNNAGVVRYYYDKKSQMLLSKVFPNGNKNMYSYDNNFRLKTIQSYDSNDSAIGGVQYDWDTDGTLNGKKSGNVSRILEKLQELRANEYSSNFASIYLFKDM